MTTTNQMLPTDINGKALDKQWICLHTQTQREKKAEEMLNRISFDYGLELSTYCPMIQIRGTYPKRVWDDTEKRYITSRVPRIQTFPLFPSYLFATSFPQAEYADIRLKGCKAAWVYSVGTIAPEFILAIYDREQHGVVRLNEDLQIGGNAQITDGSMAGMAVKIKSILYAATPMQDRITILFSLLGREHTAEVSRAEIRAA